MIDPAYVQRMARYNRWQNANLYGVADALSDEERRRERGAFFGSIHKTLNHLLWGDQIWMSRFSSEVEKPQAARSHEAEVASAHTPVQSPDTPSRPGALHAHASRRQTARDRPARAAGVLNERHRDPGAADRQRNFRHLR
jgi:hypothetical protein